MKMSLSIDSHALRITGNNPIKQFVWTSGYQLSFHCSHRKWKCRSSFYLKTTICIT